MHWCNARNSLTQTSEERLQTIHDYKVFVKFELKRLIFLRDIKQRVVHQKSEEVNKLNFYFY